MDTEGSSPVCYLWHCSGNTTEHLHVQGCILHHAWKGSLCTEGVGISYDAGGTHLMFLALSMSTPSLLTISILLKSAHIAKHLNTPQDRHHTHSTSILCLLHSDSVQTLFANPSVVISSGVVCSNRSRSRGSVP
jgi:hypothetical protein